jgi:L-threonylcarbamoyladenylate synthase
MGLILSETFPEEGLGLAVMNRLRKAASYRIIEA